MNPAHETIFSLALMSGLLGLSAFFSCSETALFSLPPEFLRRTPARGSRGDLLALLRERPSELLTSILFGNLLVNILFFCTGAAVSGRLAESRSDWVEALGGALALLAIIFFGEIIPKAAGITHPDGVLRVTALPLRGWFYLTRPFRRLIGRLLDRLGLHDGSSAGDGDWLTPGELKELLDAVRHEPGFGSHEKEILEDIINLSDVRVREVMEPRITLFRRPLGTDRREVMEQARLGGHRHILMYRENDDDLQGVVSLRDLFLDEGCTPLEKLLHPPMFVPETRRADTLLRELIAGGGQLAVVVDEYGGLAGLVTVEDLLSEIVGEFESEGAEEICKLDERTYRLSGQLSIRAWRELFTGFLPGQEVDSLAFDTLGGFVISLLGRMPRQEDTVSVRNLELTVESVHQRRIGTVRLRLKEPEGRT